MSYIDILFDGPPGPTAGRFVEIEDHRGRSIQAGEWVERGAYWALRIPQPDPTLTLMELMVTQGQLQAAMGHPTGHGEAGFKENMLHAHVEISEALDEINFKPWKTAKKTVDLKALATEMTDILQFWANAALCMGLKSGQLTDALRAKWEENLRRISEGEVISARLSEPKSFDAFGRNS